MLQKFSRGFIESKDTDFHTDFFERQQAPFDQMLMIQPFEHAGNFWKASIGFRDEPLCIFFQKQIPKFLTCLSQLSETKHSASLGGKFLVEVNTRQCWF